MRIAALSDIHGNLGALDAVLADVAARGVDRAVNLGDICSGPLWPRETADRLIALDLPTIAGNHERQVLAPDHAAMGASDLHAARRMRDDQLQWFARLPKTLRLDDVLLVHGTADSDLTHLLHTVTPHGLREATDDEVAARIGTTDAALVLCGHTHLPRAIALDTGVRVVNPGSVGLQAYADDRPLPYIVQSGDPRARYAIVDDAPGQWTVEFIAVDYDWTAAADVARDNGRDDWMRALRTGRL